MIKVKIKAMNNQSSQIDIWKDSIGIIAILLMISP